MALPRLDLVDPRPRWRRGLVMFSPPALVGLFEVVKGAIAGTGSHGLVVAAPMFGVSGFLVAVWEIANMLGIRREVRVRARLLAAAPSGTVMVLRGRRTRLDYGLVLVGTDGLSYVKSKNPRDTPESVVSWPEIDTLRVNPNLPGRGDLTATLNDGAKLYWNIGGADELEDMLRVLERDPVAAVAMATEQAATAVGPQPVGRTRVWGLVLLTLGTIGVAIEAIRGKPAVVICAAVLLAGLVFLVRSLPRSQPTLGRSRMPSRTDPS